jgi:hypothetical protein
MACKVKAACTMCLVCKFVWAAEWVSVTILNTTKPVVIAR